MHSETTRRVSDRYFFQHRHQRQLRIGGRPIALLVIVSASCHAANGDAAAAEQPLRFGVQVLEPLKGGTHCAANDINDSGMVAGSSDQGGTSYPHAVVWIDGKVMHITGEGVSGASCNAINAAGVVVGMSDSLGLNAFKWQAGTLTPLPTPHSCCTSAMTINSAGLIAGQASLGGVNTPNDGVMWTSDQIVPLGMPDQTVVHVYGMNDAGTIVGMSDFAGMSGYHPFVWNNGVMSPLSDDGSTWGAARAINDDGVIVGFVEPPSSTTQAAKWVNGKLQWLTSFGGPLSHANDINAGGWIVGWAWTSSQPSITAALWIGDEAIDLNRRTLMSSSDQLYDARGINTLGQIVGEGIFDDGFRGYVLSPLSAGDVNGDFAVNVQDLLGVIAQWGACPVPLTVSTCQGDLNLDGAVNVADLLSVIEHWGG